MEVPQKALPANTGPEDNLSIEGIRGCFKGGSRGYVGVHTTGTYRALIFPELARISGAHSKDSSMHKHCKRTSSRQGARKTV